MNLQPFVDTPFDDDNAFDDFRFSLQLNHDRIAAVMFAAGLPYRTYPLADSGGQRKDWQQNLQQELQSIFTLNGLTGLPDFAGVELDKEEDFHDFMQSLVFVERRINAQLGIL